MKNIMKSIIMLLGYPADLIISSREKIETAFHEAGHLVIACLYGADVGEVATHIKVDDGYYSGSCSAGLPIYTNAEEHYENFIPVWVELEEYPDFEDRVSANIQISLAGTIAAQKAAKFKIRVPFKGLMALHFDPQFRILPARR